MTATEAYNNRIEEARQLLASITKGLAEHVVDATKAERIDWGHVGNMARLVECLKAAEEAICGGGE